MSDASGAAASITRVRLLRCLVNSTVVVGRLQCVFRRFVRLAALQPALCCEHWQCCVFFNYVVHISHAVVTGIGYSLSCSYLNGSIVWTLIMSVGAFNFHSHVFRKGRLFIFSTLQTTRQFRCCLWTWKCIVVSDKPTCGMNEIIATWSVDEQPEWKEALG